MSSIREKVLEIIRNVPECILERFRGCGDEVSAEDAIIYFLEERLNDLEEPELTFLQDNWKSIKDFDGIYELMESQDLYISCNLLGPLSGDWMILTDTQPREEIYGIMIDGIPKGG